MKFFISTLFQRSLKMFTLTKASLVAMIAAADRTEDSERSSVQPHEAEMVPQTELGEIRPEGGHPRRAVHGFNSRIAFGAISSSKINKAIFIDQSLVGSDNFAIP